MPLVATSLTGWASCSPGWCTYWLIRHDKKKGLRSLIMDYCFQARFNSCKHNTNSPVSHGLASLFYWSILHSISYSIRMWGFVGSWEIKYTFSLLPSNSIIYLTWSTNENHGEKSQEKIEDLHGWMLGAVLQSLGRGRQVWYIRANSLGLQYGELLKFALATC